MQESLRLGLTDWHKQERAGINPRRDRHGNFSPRTNLTIELTERTRNSPRHRFVHGDFVRTPHIIAHPAEAPCKLNLIRERRTSAPSGLRMLENLSSLRYPIRFPWNDGGANSHHTAAQPCEIPLYTTLLSQV